MTDTTTRNPNQRAIDNAAGWFETIREMLDTRDAAREECDDRAYEAATEEITKSVLSVMVRDGWRQPGSQHNDDGPEEYEILLTTGGPALRIYGGVGRHGEPDLDPMLQWQDWGTPWTDWWPDKAGDIAYKDTLREFACCFYFGD